MRDHIKALYEELYADTPSQQQAPKSPLKPVEQQPSSSPPVIDPNLTPKHTQPLLQTLQKKSTETLEFTYNEILKSQPQDPSTKLQYQGVQSLSNLELISLLLSNSSRDQSVERLAIKVLPLLLKQPFTMDLDSLQNIKGMNIGKSTRILATMELARRFPYPGNKQLNTPTAIYRQIAHFADQQENLIAINLNGACETLSIRLITRGTVNRSLIHPREVFTHAVREQANSVIIAHNHPTGYLQPSEEDLNSTRRLQDAAQILGIKLLDHIIFSETEFLSMAEEGLL